MIMFVRTPRLLHGTLLCTVLGLSACGGSGGDGPPSTGPTGDGNAAGTPPAGPVDGGLPVTEGPGTDSPGTGGPVPGAQNAGDGLRLVEVATEGADGVPSLVTYGWDEIGRLQVERVSVNGTVTEVRRYDWTDAQRFERRQDDVGADGSIDRVVEYTFGPDGRISLASVSGADGSALETLTWSVGDDGFVESLARESADALLSRESFDLDAGGELQSSLIDSDGDGLADRVLGYRYDDDGVVSGTTLRSLQNDAVIERQTWRYERGACLRGWMNSAQRSLCVSFR